MNYSNCTDLFVRAALYEEVKSAKRLPELFDRQQQVNQAAHLVALL